MLPNNKLVDYVTKADMALADLTSGGRWQPEQLKKYIVVAIQKSVMMKYVTVTTIPTPEYLLPRLTTMGDVMQPGVSGSALAEAERSKPGFGSVTLTSQLAKAEVDYPEEVLEDQIESGTFAKTVAAYTAAHCSKDIEKLLCYGDTVSGATAWMKLMNGFLTTTASWVYNAGSTSLSADHLDGIMQTRPEEFDDDGEQAFYTNRKARADYRKSLKNRGTPLGDAIIEGAAGKELGYDDIPLRRVPLFPNNLGVGGNWTNVWYGNAKQVILAYYRKMVVKTDYQARAGKYALIITMRLAVGMEYEAAACKGAQILGQ